MPVTAKLSRRFYDKLGDDIASELVDWFNAVDSEYKSDLRELNDRNWERFRAELGTLRSELRGDMAKQATGFEAELVKMRAEIQSEFGMIRAEFAQFRAEVQSALAAQRSELIKWMFLFWSGTMVPIVGLLIAVIALVK